MKKEIPPPKKYGGRIPCDFYRTKGVGFSDHDHHTGSYHQALYNAGIADFNIIGYSSMLARESREIQRPMENHRGQVMEVIMSSVTVGKGELGICGIKWAKIMDRETGLPAGGIVVERSLTGTTDDALMAEELGRALVEVYQNGFMEKYDITTSDIIIEKVYSDKKYGTALCCLCFTSFIFPEIS